MIGGHLEQNTFSTYETIIFDFLYKLDSKPPPENKASLESKPLVQWAGMSLRSPF